MVRITPKGPIVIQRPVGEIPGICCKRPIHRKKMLAYLRNCSYRNFGIKVTNVYFLVDMELLLNFTICVELSRTFLVVACICWLGIVLLGEFEEFGRNLVFNSVHSSPGISSLFFSSIQVTKKSSGQALSVCGGY